MSGGDIDANSYTSRPTTKRLWEFLAERKLRIFSLLLSENNNIKDDDKDNDDLEGATIFDCYLEMQLVSLVIELFEMTNEIAGIEYVIRTRIRQCVRPDTSNIFHVSKLSALMYLCKCN